MASGAEDIDSFIEASLSEHPDKLSLREKNLTEIPASVFSPLGGSIETLDVSSNSIAALPSEFALESLRRLVVSNNKLTSLDGVARVANLSGVIANGNKISNLPSDLEWPNVEWLYLEHNRLSELPESVASLEKLKGIRLSKNKFSSFPPPLLRLENLLELSLGKNALTSVPEELSTMVHLMRLELPHNKLESLPPSIGDLRNLEVLDVGGNALSVLPDSIGDLEKLTELTVRENPSLSLIPESITKCTALQLLDASSCSLSSVPASLSSLDALVEVYISKNQISSLPPLPSVELLDVSYNKLHSMEDISQMPNLVRLNVCNNQLKYLCRFESLTKLLEVAAARNAIEGISSSISAAKGLKTLDVSHNKLHSLPQQLALMEELDVIRVGRNNLDIPEELQKAKSADGIKRYLLDRSREKMKWTKQTVAILGQPGVGKSAVFHHLTKDGNQGEFSHGVRSGEWLNQGVHQTALDFDHTALSNAVANFFICPRSMFLVVFKMVDVTSGKLEYWLRSIVDLAGRCPIVLVGTHSDDSRCNPVFTDELITSIRSDFGGEFSNIVDICPVNGIDGSGIESIKSTLSTTAKQYKTLRVPLSLSYSDLESSIARARSSDRSTIPWNEWRCLCESCGFEGEDVQSATEFFVELGMVLMADAKGTSFKSLVIVKPLWLVNAYLSIIRAQMEDGDSASGGSGKGIMPLASLGKVWKDFDEALWPSLLSSLERYEVMFALPYKREADKTCLLPTLLSADRPGVIPTIWPSFSDTLQLGRNYKFRTMPLNLFSRLLVRIMHIPLLKCVHFWSTGCYLTMHEEEALVNYKRSSYQLTVQVRNCESGGKLLRLLIETAEALIQGYEDVICTVPCAHCVSARNYNPIQFPIENITEAVMEGEAFMFCNGVHPVRIDVVAPDLAFTDFSGQKINFEEIELKEEIGVGAFGKVFSGTYDGQDVAVKKLDKGMGSSSMTGTTLTSSPSSTNEMSLQVPTSTVSMSTTMTSTASGFGTIDPDLEQVRRSKMEMFNEFQRECWIMGCMNHINLVRLIGMCIKPLSMVMELCHLGSLYRLLEHEKDQFSAKTQARLALDTARGMKYLHTVTPPVIHRDLRSPNVMVLSLNHREKVLAKVGDFGLARLLAPTSGADESAHNPHWLAPEVMRGEPYTKTADVYSFGVILWEIFTLEQPFHEFDEQIRNPFEFRRGVIGGMRPTIPDTVAPEVAELIQDCWQDKAEQRPGFPEIAKRLHEVCLGLGIKEKLLAAEEAAEGDGGGGGGELNFAATKKVKKSSKKASKRAAKNNVNRKDGHKTKCVGTLDGVGDSVLSMVATDHQVWAGLGNGQIIIYDHSGAEVKRIKASKTGGRIYTLVRSGKTVWSAGEDGIVTIWNGKNGKKIKTLKKHKDQLIKAMLEVTTKKTIRVWSGDASGTVIIWNGKGSEQNHIDVGEPVTAMCQYENIVWVGLVSGNIAIVDIDTLEFVKWKAHDTPINSMCLVKKEMWTAGNDSIVRVWTAQSGKRIAELKGHTGRVHVLHPVMANTRELGRQLYVWSGSWDTSILIWDTDEHMFVQQLPNAHGDAIRAMCSVPVKKSKDYYFATNKVPNDECWSGAQEMCGKVKRWEY